MDLKLLFRIFYSSFYTLLNIILVGLLLVTPSDAIQQALKNSQLYNVFVISGCYVLTVLLAILIYASRLYTNRSVLVGIPKTWIPIEKGDVNDRVRNMIVASLSRSALIAWDARPRIPPPSAAAPPMREATPDQDTHKELGLLKRFSKSTKEEPVMLIPPHQPVWGKIEHSGWASPISPDLPDLHYITVIMELPHLIEAKVVALAPVDATSAPGVPVPDVRALDILQRPASMGLRDYISHLSSLGVITSHLIAADFLAAYEHARFSAQALSEDNFRSLMNMFAELLRSINPLNQALLEDMDGDAAESEIDDNLLASISSHSNSGSSLSVGTIHTAPSRHTRGTTTQRHSIYSTAPATPRKPKHLAPSRSPSLNTFAQTRHPYSGSGSSVGTSSESASLRSVSEASVIRLRRPSEDGDLPFIITPSP